MNLGKNDKALSVFHLSYQLDVYLLFLLPWSPTAYVKMTFSWACPCHSIDANCHYSAFPHPQVVNWQPVHVQPGLYSVLNRLNSSSPRQGHFVRIQIHGSSCHQKGGRPGHCVHVAAAVLTGERLPPVCGEVLPRGPPSPGCLSHLQLKSGPGSEGNAVPNSLPGSELVHLHSTVHIHPGWPI